MKILQPTILASVLTLALCLSGCGSSNSVDLDKHDTLCGMTYGISSEWEEVYFDDESDSYGYDMYASEEDAASITFLYSNLYPNETGTESMERQIDSLKASTDPVCTNIEYEMVDTSTVSGNECTTFKYSYSAPPRAVQSILRHILHT